MFHVKPEGSTDRETRNYGMQGRPEGEARNRCNTQYSVANISTGNRNEYSVANTIPVMSYNVLWQ